jgi:hypothetical protein
MQDEDDRDQIEEVDLNVDFWEGFNRADLAPLARLLRSEYELDHNLRRALADAIEGKSTQCRITSRRGRRGRPAGDVVGEVGDQMRVGGFVEERVGSKFEAAISEAGAQFGLGRTSTANAYAAVKGKPRHSDERLRLLLEERASKFEREDG